MKALVGSWDRRPYHLLAEITALRSRVSELQQELDDARAENAALRHALTQDVAAEVDMDVAIDGADERAVALSSTA